MSNIIFIGGIHGVGKGTLCKQLCQQYNLKHLSASKVLKWGEISDKKNKKVKNLKSTQERLLEGLSRIVKPNKKYLLDGHFCLLNSNGIPEKVPEITFFKINPFAIIIITLDIETILKRLENRDNEKYNLETLKKMQILEVQLAKETAYKLKIPFFNITSNKNKSLHLFLANYASIN